MLNIANCPHPKISGCALMKKIQVSYALVMHLRNGQFLLNKFNASSSHNFGLEIVEEMELSFMY